MTYDPISQRIAERQRQAMRDRDRGIIYDRPPPPKPKPTAEDDGPTYLSPAWHAARRAAEEATKAPPTPVNVPPAYRQENQPKRKKRRKPSRSFISKKMAAQQDRDRRCEVCGVQTDGLSSLCNKHLRRRRKYGSAAITRRPLHLKDYEHLVLAARRYLRHHRPPSNIIEAMQSFLIPADALPFDRRCLGPRKMLRREMAWWGDPKSRKRWRTKWQSDYTPRAHLAVLVAVVAKIEELDGKGFPDDAEQITLMYALVRLYLRPARFKVNVRATRAAPPGVIVRKRIGVPVAPTVLRMLVKRWTHADRSDLRLFVYTAAKAVLEQVRAKRDQKNRTYKESST